MLSTGKKGAYYATLSAITHLRLQANLLCNYTSQSKNRLRSRLGLFFI